MARPAFLISSVVLAILALFWLWLARPAPRQAGKRTPAPAAAQTPPSESPAARPPAEAPTPGPRKQGRFASSGRLRLQPGESAVLGYLDLSPGTSGMVVVTPARLADGNIALEVRQLQVPDHAADEPWAQDLLPAPLEYENYSAISSGQLQEMTRRLSESGGRKISMPRMVVRPGQPASTSSRVSSADGATTWLSRIETSATPVENGGFDLSLGIERVE